jgi:hypothetical protein
VFILLTGNILVLTNYLKPSDSMMGTVASIREQARYALHGGFTREYYNRTNLRQNSILVRYQERDRANPTD